jgi:3-oxoacyl-[acyl-carrier protein] reductase
LVTGASGAIGGAAARRLAAMGFTVAAHHHRTAGDAEALVAELGGASVAVGCDLTDGAATQAMVEDVAARLGPVGVLVNAAGARHDGLLVRQQPEDWHRVVEVNLFGTYHTCRAVLGPMLQARAGRIINVVSPSAVRAIPGQTAYAASKAAVVGLTRTLAQECGRRGVTVNAVSPGLVDSRMSEGIGDDAEATLLGWTALGRKTTADEVADAVAFLVGNGGVTGAVLPVDGGMAL